MTATYSAEMQSGAPSRLARKPFATAAMVQAAPDLVDALKAIMADPLARIPAHLVASASAAIIKAEGRA